MKPERTKATRPAKPLSEDEQAFWDRWPKASRYFTPEERSAYEREFPGWHPGCNLGGIIARHNTSGIRHPSASQVQEAIAGAARMLGASPEERRRLGPARPEPFPGSQAK